MFSEKEKKEISNICFKYPVKDAALMPILYITQEKFGYISEDHIKYLSGMLEIPEVQIKGVVSFYEMFHSEPKGKYLIDVCSNVSCLICNSEMVFEILEKKLGIKAHQTTKDNKFTIREVECLGSCGTAPVMSINDKYYDNLTEQKIIEIIDTLE